MARSYSRDDVQTHSDGYRPGNPAVNVKIYDSLEDVNLPLCTGSILKQHLCGQTVTHIQTVRDYRKCDRAGCYRDIYTEDEYTHEWIRDNVNENKLDSYFWEACADGVEMIQKDAREIFGNVDVYQEGRSGGWIVVHGLDDIDEWDAIALGRWRRFEKLARAYADDVMRSTVTTIYMNEYEWARDEADEAARAARQDIATVEA